MKIKCNFKCQLCGHIFHDYNATKTVDGWQPFAVIRICPNCNKIDPQWVSYDVVSKRKVGIEL